MIAETQLSPRRLTCVENRLSSVTHANASPTPIESYGYTYDAEDRITRLAELSGTIDYVYDGRGRLTTATYSDPNRTDEAYAFDANRNRQSSANATGTQTDANNRLSTGGRYTYTYNDRGDTIRRTDELTGDYRDFVWDHRGRLVKISDLLADGTITRDVTYTHDSLERRIGRTVDPDGDGYRSLSAVHQEPTR